MKYDACIKYDGQKLFSSKEKTKTLTVVTLVVATTILVV